MFSEPPIEEKVFQFISGQMSCLLQYLDENIGVWAESIELSTAQLSCFGWEAVGEGALEQYQAD